MSCKRVPIAIRVWLSIAAVLVIGGNVHAGLVNGSFEDSPSFTGWTTSASGGTVDLQTSSGAWIPCTVTFNSGPYNQAIVFLAAYGTPNGRCWFDNLRPNGFTIANPSFESGSGNSFTGWNQLDAAGLVQSSTEHVSHGSRSVMLFDPAYAAEMIRINQIVNVTPYTDYSYTFDFYMEDSFVGGIRCPVYSTNYYNMGGMSNPDIDQLIADRSSFGNKSCRMALTGGNASVQQTVATASGVHMEAVAYVKRKNLTGSVTLYVENAETGAVIASVPATSTDNVWQSMNVRFVSPSTQIRFRLAANGTGTVLVDGMSLSAPLLSPPAQMVTWKTAGDDLVLPSSLGYTISGPYTNILTTGISMLRSDLQAKLISLGQAGSQPALIRIFTNIGDWTKPESYHLSIDVSGIIIEAPTERGAFYGLMTVLQLITTNTSGQKVVVGCEIDDWPDLPWRALNKGIIGLTVDWMARHKLNTAFHISDSEIGSCRDHGMTPIPHANIVDPEHEFGIWDANLCEGVAGHDEFTLPTGVKRSLTGRNVINPTGATGDGPISIANASFESPSIAPDQSRLVVPAGWSVLANPGSIKTVSDPASVGVPPNPDGAQLVMSSGSNTFLHQNTGVRIQAGKTYTLTAFVTGGAQGNQASLMLGASSTQTGAFETSYLLAWTTLTVGPSAWQQRTATVTVPSGSALIGKYLCVVLRSPLGWVMFDKVSLSISTPISPVTVRNAAETITYTKDTDYILTSGVTAYPYLPTAAPYQIERKPGGAIADGQPVKVDYEHVPDYSPFVLCLAEIEPQNQMADWAKNKVNQYSLDYIGLHMSEEPSTIAIGPRSEATGLQPAQLVANYYQRLDDSIEEARPTSRMISWADAFMRWQNAVNGLDQVPPLLPDDMILHCWYYNPSGAVDYNKQSAELWDGLGHDFLLTSWYDYLNIHITAAAARWALLKGMTCLGTSSWAYNPDGSSGISPWIVETVNCAWRVPGPGEDGYYDFEGAAEGTHSQSQLGMLSMHIELADFIGDKSSVPVTVELTKSGAVKRQAAITLGGDNDCFFADIAPDTYDVRVSANGFLRKVAHGVVVPISSNGTMTTTLVNGDVNGDNAITNTDLSDLIANLDQTGGLDGDGAVTTSDLSIVIKNMGLTGD